ncbi:MAG: hypothetical protein LBG11_01935 [Bifidobacteriaceae bacterium]|jgi:hypothetical protein|nr:hypothetical protein [Bifidobacteriaceae bacterium]
MASGIVSTATGLIKSFGHLIGASVRAGSKGMDSLANRLRDYADDKPPEAPIKPNSED